MKEFEVYIPLYYNDGSPIENRKILRLKKRLIDEFGGLTLFPQRNEGVWRVGGYTFREEIIIARVISADAARAGRFFARLRKSMQRGFDQAEVLIVSRDVEVL